MQSQTECKAYQEQAAKWKEIVQKLKAKCDQLTLELKAEPLRSPEEVAELRKACELLKAELAARKDGAGNAQNKILGKMLNALSRASHVFEKLTEEPAVVGIKRPRT